jgi:hypothetical protein
MTPGIFQVAWMQIEVMGGEEVMPQETYVTEPFLIECVPKYSGSIPFSMKQVLWSR